MEQDCSTGTLRSGRIRKQVPTRRWSDLLRKSHSSFLLRAGKILFLLGLLELLDLRPLLACFLLLVQGLRLNLLGLHFVDGLNEDALILVGVTLGLPVEEVVHVLVNLLRLPVLSEQATEHTLAAHPE